jgi:hypothetical protein
LFIITRVVKASSNKTVKGSLYLGQISLGG